MKKLIVLSVVFALVAGVAFAVDLSGGVIGTVNVVSASSVKESDVLAGGEFNRLRIEGAGESGDGKFGGWIRLDPASASWAYNKNNGKGPNGGNLPATDPQGYELSWSDGVAGLAWWKPIDQLKLTIGGQPDGMWGKEGVAGWMFYQSASDTGVADGGNNVWSGGGEYDQGLKFRNAFFRGFGGNGLLLEIKPIDMIGVNIAVPFIDKAGAKFEDILKAVVAQVDLNFDFGNIAITYEGEGSYIQNGNVNWAGSDAGVIYGYFGLTAIENIGLDIGVGLQMNEEGGRKNPFVVGLGLKYSGGAFGVKFRTALSLPGEDFQEFKVLADVLPYYVVNDSLRIFVSAGLGIKAPSKNAKDFADALGLDADPVVGWRFNPYVEIGEEWGPKFLVGIKLIADGSKDGDDKAILNFSIPIALSVSF